MRFEFAGHKRARPDKRHFTFENIYNLREFIYGCFAQKSADFCNARVIGKLLICLPLGFVFFIFKQFAKDFVDYFVQEDGSIKTYDIKEYNLDNINTASNLFFLYESL